MKLSKRDFLVGGAAALSLPMLGRAAHAQAIQGAAIFAPKPGAWRNFEIKTQIDLPDPKGAAQAWIPVPSFKSDDWMRPGETTFTTKTGTAARVKDPKSGAEMIHVTWAASETAPSIEVVSRFQGRDRAIDLVSTAAVSLTPEERKRYTAATELLVLDGIVKETADKITANAKTDVDKARAIYEWVVDNTFRNAKTRGCGTGDIASMLKTGNLSGKCADLNALYVGLARAAGLPARDVYGIRVAASKFGYKSLGANSATITKAQHCRAEVFLTGLGWVPVDPADVRKVVLEEPPANLALNDEKVLAARKALFGAWETNWLAYNDAHDVVLPGSKGPSIPFLMYPQAELAGTRLDPLEPDAFKYVITAREIDA